MKNIPRSVLKKKAKRKIAFSDPGNLIREGMTKMMEIVANRTLARNIAENSAVKAQAQNGFAIPDGVHHLFRMMLSHL